jgi:uncharacterized membrane protein
MSEQMYTPPTDVTQDDKTMALLSYIFPLIVPLIVLLSENRKNRPIQRLHAVQSLTLTVISIIVSITVIGACLSPVLYVWGIVVGVNAYQDKQMAIPFVSDFVKKQGWVH